jgi:hypothetical protein
VINIPTSYSEDFIKYLAVRTLFTRYRYKYSPGHFFSDIFNLCCSVELTDPLFTDVQELEDCVFCYASLSSVSQKAKGILTFFQVKAIYIYGMCAFNYSLNLIYIKTTSFWDVTSCSLIDGTDVSEKPVAFILWEENGGSRFLQNVSTIYQTARRHISKHSTLDTP